ncbi:MAG: type II secretion system F family protein [Solirubrobacterales bacterium]
MKVLLLIGIWGLGLALNRAAGKPDVTTSAAMTEYGFRLRFLAPLSWQIARRLNISLRMQANPETVQMLLELLGERGAGFWGLIHLAQKVAYGLVTSLLFVSFGLVGSVSFSFVMLGLATMGLMIWLPDHELLTRLENRKRAILLDLPAVVSTLGLLLDAGMPLMTAIRKLIQDQAEERPLYRELTRVMIEVSGGKPTVQAFEDLAARCRLPELNRLVTIILMSLSRGNAEGSGALRSLAVEAWARRKDMVRRLGEEAGSKLVIPMAMVFSAIGLIVLAPAMLSMGW